MDDLVPLFEGKKPYGCCWLLDSSGFQVVSLYSEVTSIASLCHAQAALGERSRAYTNA